MIGEPLLNGRVFLNHGDSRDVLRAMPDCYFDSIVCDPPYALVSIVKRFGGPNAKPAKGDVYARASSGFMQSTWDTGETAFAVEFWSECFRVLKPGGHVAAFSATRTQHRMMVAIEDAGFEIRDDILNMIASDEPARRFFASLDDEQRSALVACLDDTSFTGLAAWAYGTGFPKSHDVSKAIDKAAGVARKVVGTEYLSNDMRNSALLNVGKGDGGRDGYERAITVATSPDAIKWSGFGTALKPAWEPIVLARKPLVGTVAANVLEHGTGAINVDGCRVGNDEITTSINTAIQGGNFARADGRGIRQETTQHTGRHPANLIHDGSPEVVAMFPDDGDAGSAARFFYSAKADADDRIGSRHPTVKPVDLMMWLVRLVTPKGGIVLDPFAGSGSTGEAAWAEGMTAVLIEREAKFCDDIRRRMQLATAGSDERAREAIKANGKAKTPTDDIDDVPLFKALV